MSAMPKARWSRGLCNPSSNPKRTRKKLPTKKDTTCCPWDNLGEDVGRDTQKGSRKGSFQKLNFVLKAGGGRRKKKELTQSNITLRKKEN